MNRSGVQDQPGQHSETLSLQKIQKLAGHGVVCPGPATWEAEAEELLEPRRRRLREPRLRHCSLTWETKQDCLKKKEEKERMNNNIWRVD